MSNSKRVTLKDIALETGFTVNTVSRALKNRSDISQETKSIIREAASRLNYVGDVAASSLRSGATQTLAMIVGDISNPFFSSLVRGIELAARQHGYSLIIFNSNEDSQWEKSAILSAYSKRVDGIIICPVQENDDNIRLLQGLGVPFVLSGRYFPHIDAHAVVWDDKEGGRLATNYLIEKGHSSILFLGGPLHVSSSIERLQGYRDAHASAGIPVREELICLANITSGNGREAVAGALMHGPPFTAIVAFSDLMAYEALSALSSALGRSGEHFPIVGFDDIQTGLMLPQRFASICCISDQSEAIVRRLVNLIKAKPCNEPRLLRLGIKLILP